MMPNLLPHRMKDVLFRVVKFQYNTYEIQHPQVVGTLRLTNLPTNIMEIPDEMIPEQARSVGIPTYMIGGQAIVAFSNRSKKGEPSPILPTQEDMKKARRIELTNYILDQPFEPWNEFVVQGDPPISVKVRTILAKLEWYPDYTNQLGDPFLWANHSTTHNVSISNAGESGLT